LTRYHARWVLPIAGEPIENGTVAESDGKITYVGARDGAPAGDDYELGDAVLLPGLINTHTHLELTVMRGFLEDLCFSDWINRLRRSRNEVLTNETLLDSARLGILEGLHAGITTYADTCSSGVVMQAMKELGVRGIMYQETFGPDPKSADAAMKELDMRVSALAEEQSDLVALGISPHAPYTVSDELYSAAGKYARSKNLPLAMHIAESRAEEALVAEASGEFADAWKKRGIEVKKRARSPIALLEKLGLLGDRSLLIHCVRLDDDDVSAIARSRSSVAHCPASNAKFGHGVAPRLPLLAAGVRVGIGSDSVASNNRMDLLDEARLSVLLHRAVTRSHDAFGARGALRLATLGGAEALGLSDRVGSLEPGKDADLAAFRLDRLRTIPTGNPEAAALFALAGRGAELVAVKGRRLVEKGKTIEPLAPLLASVAEASRALHAWAGANAG
jgi:cytosine/adenosine deaminase-related metal-dependent hydrolase